MVLTWGFCIAGFETGKELINHIFQNPAPAPKKRKERERREGGREGEWEERAGEQAQ